jgi:hypothetical protein
VNQILSLQPRLVISDLPRPPASGTGLGLRARSPMLSLVQIPGLQPLDMEPVSADPRSHQPSGGAPDVNWSTAGHIENPGRGRLSLVLADATEVDFIGLTYAIRPAGVHPGALGSRGFIDMGGGGRQPSCSGRRSPGSTRGHRGIAKASPGRDPGQLPWAVTLYSGVFMNNSLGGVFVFQYDPQDSYIGVLAVSREIWNLTRHIRFELEGQVAKNFGEQTNWELNALLVGRWVTFPWNDYVYTTFAVGEGVSYATAVPKLEKELQDTTHQLQNYLMFELTLSPPQHREWAFVTRIHHRSALFGVYGDGGSNVLAVGVKYRF